MVNWKTPLATTMNVNAGPVQMYKEAKRRGGLVKKYGEKDVRRAEVDAYSLGQKKQSNSRRKDKMSPAPVEKYKLSPDLLEIERSWRKREKLAEALKHGIVARTSELNVMTTVLDKVQKQQDALSKMVPPDRLEVEGTPIPEDVDLNINY